MKPWLRRKQENARILLAIATLRREMTIAARAAALRREQLSAIAVTTIVAKSAQCLRQLHDPH